MVDVKLGASLNKPFLRVVPSVLVLGDVKYTPGDHNMLTRPLYLPSAISTCTPELRLVTIVPGNASSFKNTSRRPPTGPSAKV